MTMLNKTLLHEGLYDKQSKINVQYVSRQHTIYNTPKINKTVDHRYFTI